MYSIPSKSASLKAAILQYKPAIYSKKGKDKYVYYYVLDPHSVECGYPQLKRMRTKFNDYESARERDAAALRFRDEINRKLAGGWNPLVEQFSVTQKSWTKLHDVFDTYSRYIEKQVKDGALTPRTLQDYSSRLKLFREYTEEHPVEYVHMIDRPYIESYLEYLYVERGSLPRSRNNTLQWLNIFCNYLVAKGYIKENPCAGIKKMREGEKKRKPFSDDDRKVLFSWLHENDKPYLLACQFMYYTLIRPIELGRLKVGNISIEQQTVFVGGDISKNHHDGVVTMPKALVQTLQELRVTEKPSDWYLFGDDFLPSPTAMKPKRIAKRWEKVRELLHFPDYYQFYSLKDTGITDMINRVGLNVAKDQARHSSVAITNYYAARNQMSAHPELKEFE